MPRVALENMTGRTIPVNRLVGARNAFTASLPSVDPTPRPRVCSARDHVRNPFEMNNNSDTDVAVTKRMEATHERLKRAVGRLESAMGSASAGGVGGGEPEWRAERGRLRAELKEQQQRYEALRREYDPLVAATDTVSRRLDSTIDQIRNVLDS